MTTRTLFVLRQYQRKHQARQHQAKHLCHAVIDEAQYIKAHHVFRCNHLRKHQVETDTDAGHLAPGTDIRTNQQERQHRQYQHHVTLDVIQHEEGTEESKRRRDRKAQRGLANQAARIGR
ncbi:hypothetical protein D3C81_1749610 [compost metagenome]